MNSFERIKLALEVKQPDRVPIMEFVIDEKVARKIIPDFRDIPDFCNRMDMDAVGCSANFKKEKLGNGLIVDEWGVKYKCNQEVVQHPIEGPVKTFDDLKKYKPLNPNTPHILAHIPDIVKRYKNKRAIIFHHRAAFMWSAYLMGFENLLMSFITQPAFAESVMDLVFEINKTIIKNAIKMGVNIVVLGDDYASNIGPFVSPMIFKKFILPKLKEMVDIIHKEGAYCIKHTDGNIWEIIDMIVNTGIDGLNPIEPTAGMDIGEVKKKYGNRICLIGNIDCQALLSFQLPEEVDKVVKECIKKAAPGGGFILSSSNSIHSSVKPENFIALLNAGRKYGKYSV